MASQNYASALITGSSGFIGKYFLPQLELYFPSLHICITGRNSYNSANPNVTYEYCDLTRPINLNITVDIIFHLAGEKLNVDKMWEVNYDGTVALVKWASSHGVKRFIYLSSVGVYGAGNSDHIITENSTKHPNNLYESSKNAAEEFVKEYCSNSGIEYVIIQPSNVIGWVNNNKSFPLLTLIKTVNSGFFTYFGNKNTYFNYVSLDTVIDFLISAASNANANQVYIVNSPHQSHELIGWISDALDVPHPKRRVPLFLGYLFGYLSDFIKCFSGIPIPFGMQRYSELTNTTRYVSSHTLQNIMNKNQISLKSALVDLVRRYQSQGLL